MSKRSMVRTANLSKTYGSGDTAVRAVDNITIDVGQGELVLIMGPSGSGKTTLLSMLGGLLRPTSGQVFINGTEITALKESRLPGIRAREIGFIFQAFNLLTSLNVEDNILFPVGLAGGGKKEANERAGVLIGRLGLMKRRRHVPRDLSGGEKQRVAIARALINEPRVLLADEPTGNLDSRSGYEVLMVLHDVVRDEGRTVVIVTHDPRVEEIADRILWLEDGKIRDRKDEAHSWVKDPVCGMPVDQWTATFFRDWRQERFVFCSSRCRERFDEKPDRYAPPVEQAMGGARERRVP